MKLVSLLSGGIDSPVASYLMLKQGVELVCVHFHHQTPDKLGVENKVVQLCQQLATFAKHPIKLYLIPFKDVQFALIKAIPATHRMVVYRRFMLRIAEKILEKEGAEGFVTGDNLGQVASQTLDNITVIYQATKQRMLTPLLGADKVDTVKESKKIGTYDISILPYEDCCSFLIAQHPVTHARLADVEKMEATVPNPEEMITHAVENAKIMVFPGAR
ncbi:MAG TPA: 7-cyano-7-deazaguanine synthase [Candidatus Binatia bacterium]|nr:7-cyano-7-deazaguanine synthase [Candidatus Binatia bacterium]